MKDKPRTICFCTNTDEETIRKLAHKHRKKRETMTEKEFIWFIWEQCSERLKKKPVQRCGKCVERIKVII